MSKQLATDLIEDLGTVSPDPEQVATRAKSGDRSGRGPPLLARPSRGPTHVDLDPYLWGADVERRYDWSPRSRYRNEKLLPPPDVEVNGRKGWRQSTLDRHDAEQRGLSLARVRKSIEELREFVLAHSDLGRAERAMLEKLLTAATRFTASDFS